MGTKKLQNVSLKNKVYGDKKQQNVSINKKIGKTFLDH